MRDPSGAFKYTERYYLRALDTQGATDFSCTKQHVSGVAIAPPASAVSNLSLGALRDGFGLRLRFALAQPGGGFWR